MAAGLFLGIDGGASKTRAVLLDGEGRLLGSHLGPSSALSGVPSEAVLGVLRQAQESLLRQAGRERRELSGAGLGLNGVDFSRDWEGQHVLIARGLGLEPERVSLVNDGIVALWGGSSARACAILQHGSGVTGAFRSRPGAEQSFDHLNSGRLFDLRTQLFFLVARMLDGRAERSPLADLLLECLGAAEQDFHETVYTSHGRLARRPEILDLLVAAWEARDSGALLLFEKALEDYALTAQAMLWRTGVADAELVLGGGVLSRLPEAALEVLGRRIRTLFPAAGIRRPVLAPEFGGALMAGFREGLEVQVLFDSLRERQVYEAVRL